MSGREDRTEPASEQELWRQFESTGSVQQYLRYRQAHSAAEKERTDAEHGDGAVHTGGKGWRS